jgi:hypothetical protein
MGKNTRTLCVNAQKNVVKPELSAWANSAPAKVLAARTGISESRIYDWRSGRFGANAATLEIVRADRFAAAKAQLAQARAVIRQSLGPLADLYSDAIERVLGGEG